MARKVDGGRRNHRAVGRRPPRASLGIKIRTARDRVIRLTDTKTGRWIADVRWRPQGTVWLELADYINQAVAEDRVR